MEWKFCRAIACSVHGEFTTDSFCMLMLKFRRRNPLKGYVVQHLSMKEYSKKSSGSFWQRWVWKGEKEKQTEKENRMQQHNECDFSVKFLMRKYAIQVTFMYCSYYYYCWSSEFVRVVVVSCSKEQVFVMWNIWTIVTREICSKIDVYSEGNVQLI